MNIIINISTGNYFFDGSSEIGTMRGYTVDSRLDLEKVMDNYPEYVDFFITTEDGKEIDIYDLICMLE